MFKQAIQSGGVAVVTGGASGVGFAAATRFAEAGLAVLLADLAGEPLDTGLAALRDKVPGNDRIAAQPTDVSDPASVALLAEAAFDIGPVAVLMNNAGIARPTSAWEGGKDWRRMFAVNLFGVLNGLEAFVPRMIAAGTPGAIINTGSKQGITSPPGNAGYNASKAAVKTLTEMLAHELREAGAPISAHLFVPGFTYTGMIARFIPEKPPSAWSAEETVDHMLARAERGDFYILCPDNAVTEAHDRARIQWASHDITENRPALSRWHPDHAEAFAAFETAKT